jgi:glutamine synthetase
MVGSSDSIAPANVVLNTIVAESFRDIADELEKADNFDMACHDMIKKLFTDHHAIVFNGNGYTDEWIEEAARRGLPNIPSMVDAIPALVTPKAIKLFESFGVFTEAELRSRAEIKYEAYAKAINIEAKAMIDIAGKQIIPSVISYTTELANSVISVSEAGADASIQKELLDTVTGYLKNMKTGLSNLENAVADAAAIEEGAEQAKFFKDTVKTAMDELRAPADKLEMIVDKEYWPFPSYGDLIFEV